MDAMTPTLDAVCLAARIILENGGETYRAEETVRRMGEGFGLNHVASFAVPSGLFISYRNSAGSLETSVKRVYRTERNLSRVNEANRISRLCATGKMDSDQALQALRNAETLRGPVSPAGRGRSGNRFVPPSAGLLRPAARRRSGVHFHRRRNR